MKITSGEFKYRNLAVPGGIRPTTEKVREAVFSMIREWIPGAVVVDLFAGSGAMGLEAISRGAEKCYFCDSNRRNIKILQSNIEHCTAGDRAVIFNCDFRAAVSRITDKADIVILDPPYDMTEYYIDALNLLRKEEVIDEGGIVIAEHLYDNKLPQSIGGLTKFKEKKYGSIGVDVYICE